MSYSTSKLPFKLVSAYSMFGPLSPPIKEWGARYVVVRWAKGKPGRRRKVSGHRSIAAAKRKARATVKDEAEATRFPPGDPWLVAVYDLKTGRKVK